MKKSALITLIISYLQLFSFVTIVQADQGRASYDHFDIHPILKPIIIELTPFSGVVRKKREVFTTYKSDGTNEVEEQNTILNASLIKTGDQFRYRVDGRFNKIQIIFDFFMEKNGAVFDVDYSTPEMKMSQAVDNILEPIIEGIKNAMPVFPSSGIKTGDNLYENARTASFEQMGFSMIFNGIVKGLVYDDNRPSLLVDLDGTTIKSTLFSSVMMTGWMLIDVETGIISDSKTDLTVWGNGNGGFHKFNGYAIEDVIFPQSSNKVIGAAKTKNTIEYRLQKVKELLENDLITADDAKRKRQEILDNF